MAASTDATNPFEVKTCEACGVQFERGSASALSFATRRLCRSGCGNGVVPADDPVRLDRRFANKVDRRLGQGPQGECWEWIGRKDAHGYGVAKVGNQPYKAHRVALYGRDNLFDARFACHRCDNPACVRPDHLFAGVAVDNVRDMIAKGRVDRARSASRKLSADQVAQVLSDPRSSHALSKVFGVSSFTIRGIRNGTLYASVVASLKAA